MEAALEQRKFMHFLGHLDGQFTSWTKDQDLGIATGGINFFDGGRGERGGLAGACLGLAHNVPALHEQRDGFGLDGRGLLESELLNGLQHFGRQAQFSK